MDEKLALAQKPVSKGYRYFMVFLCMLTQAVPYGIAQLIQPLFVHPLVNTFHFTLASYTLIFTFGAVVGSLVSPLVGKALPKVNFKIMYLIGIVLSAGAYGIFGLSTKLPGFYLAGIICMVGSTFYSGQGVPWVINHWFPDEGRGVALGLAFCGGSVGEIFLQPITQAILKSFMVGGAKTGHLTSMMPFFIFSIALLVIGVIIALFIRVPKSNEIVSSAIDKKDRATKAQTNQDFQGWSSKEVLKMKWFWIFSIGFLIFGLGMASLNEDYAAFLDTKMSLTQVGLIGSVFGMAGIVGNISGGYLFDRLGVAKAMTYAGVMLVISILLMLLISVHPYGDSMNSVAGIGYAIASGLSVFSYMSGPAFMTKSLFGAKAQGVNLGYVSLTYAVGFAIGAPLFGVIKGMTNFTIAWCFTLIFVSVGFILLIIAALRIKRLQKQLI
ncbi:conjugated bile salt MFS transporter [Lactobacillus kefiranofaciens]|uniref:Conjugated bile salt MFS transporter n=1 Tax=Lactobacillus kefiranofaciens TaxID=267818 RepID=A0AAX3UF35_9LACO|nr:conjugated bile salt MFS transporter [Lactobacillus kefiranofaciens]AEG40454.1 Bile salt transporter [Lactobacillus kefiranofaciens subsp. kefiranofaciens]KRM22190.1 bile salt transporter [Lactobacillus kefiranofaciens subsp. kefiranofaciens DSM 5016 = JCM 6985]WGO86236.1 conjugated bile salt MFS transporter [Lactobacillus kefiranofaciens]WQH36444.1 conjugated bile salt MFS transporter [Lactobacillus kefiranofaciens]SDA49402.1 Sugar phosphate permease [Lactobacillus kefiranofaciens]